MIKFKKIEHDITKYLPDVYSFLENDKDIAAAYLFGSYGKGKPAPLSDVDFAVLLKGSYPESDYLDKQLELLAEISRMLKTDEIDIVILNRADSLLAYNVLKDGKLLFSQNEEQRVDFQVSIVDEYLDTQKLRSQNFKQMLRRIREGTYGS